VTKAGRMYIVSGHRGSSTPIIPYPYFSANLYRDHFLTNSTEIYAHKRKIFWRILSSYNFWFVVFHMISQMTMDLYRQFNKKWRGSTSFIYSNLPS